MLGLHKPFGLLVFIAVCAAVALVYWPGLSGPFLLDDFGNLADVGAWLDGERSLKSALFNNRSGPSGRPLAMGTFLLDAMLWGKSTWHFKFTNLLIHLICGLLLWRLYHRLIARDAGLSHYQWLPLALTTIWLALPIQVSSVLYVVQRMAMLSAACIIGSLWLYMHAREKIERSERGGLVLLWIGLPVLTATGYFFKENAALIPLMAAALELAYFQPKKGTRRPISIRSFFALSLGVPATITIFATPLALPWLTQAYESRSFTLLERLLTQPRVLWDYVSNILVPYGPRLGIFHDNYLKSEGLLTPLTTLLAIVGWIFVVAIAWKLRNRHPSILAGSLLFLAAHSMESSIIPLELYFEHRNYLPSIGVLLMLAGAANGVKNRLPRPTPSFRVAGKLLGLAILVVYFGATHSRAIVWSSQPTLYAQELKYNYSSPRLHSFIAGQAMERGDLIVALRHIEAAEQYSPPTERATMSLWRTAAYCSVKTAPPNALYEELDRNARGPISIYSMTAWELLAKKLEAGECPEHDASRLASIVYGWVTTTTQLDIEHSVWRTRYYLARIYAHLGNYSQAQIMADAAWQDSDFSTGIGVFLFQISATLGDEKRCREVLNQLERSYGLGDYKLDEAVVIFREALADGYRHSK